MANNYLQFSEVLPHLTVEEETWLKSQLEVVSVFRDREYAEGEVPSDLDSAGDEWYGCRAWRDLPDYDPNGSPIWCKSSFGNSGPTSAGP